MNDLFETKFAKNIFLEIKKARKDGSGLGTKDMCIILLGYSWFITMMYYDPQQTGLSDKEWMRNELEKFIDANEEE